MNLRFCGAVSRFPAERLGRDGMTSYAVVETALARMHGADPEVQRGAFRGRIKHLQRLGLPLGVKPGKGKRIEYNEEQILQLVLALELAEFGIDPTTIVSIIASHWDESIFKYLEANAQQRWLYMILSVRLMSSSWRPGGSIANGVHNISWVSVNNKIGDAVKSSTNRAILIDVFRVVNELKQILSEIEGETNDGNSQKASTT